MNKYYSNRFPQKGEKQHTDFRKAVASMLNCRRYLESRGFEEEINRFFGKKTNTIQGEISFPDGSKVDLISFWKTENDKRNDLLERIISKNSKFKRASFWDRYDRSKIILTSYRGSDYTFRLRVQDTTIYPPLTISFLNPKKFAFQYEINLDKDVITDRDVENFEKYWEELDELIKEDSLISISQNSPINKNKSESKKSKSLEEKTEIIDVWDVDIPTIENKIMGN